MRRLIEAFSGMLGTGGALGGLGRAGLASDAASAAVATVARLCMSVPLNTTAATHSDRQQQMPTNTSSVSMAVSGWSERTCCVQSLYSHHVTLP